MTTTGAAKIRYLVATNGRAIRRLGALLLVAGILGAAFTAAFPPTTTVTEVTDRSLVETETTTTATVDGDHAMYDDGEELRNEPVLVRDVAPNVTVTATTRAPPDGVAVDQRMSISYVASSSEDGVFRQRDHELASTSDTVAAEGETVESAVSLRIADVANTLEAMRDEIGDAGRVTAHLHVETAYSSADYDGTLEDRSELAVSPDSYRVPPLSIAEEHRTTTSAVVPDRGEVFRATLPGVGPVVVPHVTPLFLTLSALGLVALGAVRYGRTEFDADRERVRIHRLRYDEWISGGDLPDSFGQSHVVVPMESLEALVDVAIDSDSRVIHDSAQDRYAVLANGTAFVFSPHATGGFVFTDEAGRPKAR